MMKSHKMGKKEEGQNYTVIFFFRLVYGVTISTTKDQ